DEPKPASREVEYRANDVIPIKTRMRFATVLIFPDGEQVVEVTCGDREFWVIDAAKNLVHVKPAKEGARSNMNVMTSNGNVYTFLLVEGLRSDSTVDVRVTVELKDAAMRQRAGLDHPFEDPRRKQEMQSMTGQINAAKAEVEAAKTTAEEAKKAAAQ